VVEQQEAIRMSHHAPPLVPEQLFEECMKSVTKSPFKGFFKGFAEYQKTKQPSNIVLVTGRKTGKSWLASTLAQVLKDYGKPPEDKCFVFR